MGQHGINVRKFGTLIPPFLPKAISVVYFGIRELLGIQYPVALTNHCPPKTAFTVKANGTPVSIYNIERNGTDKVLLYGELLEHWPDPVTVSYDGSDPEFESISGVPCAEFTDELAERS